MVNCVLTGRKVSFFFKLNFLKKQAANKESEFAELIIQVASTESAEKNKTIG
jgi:hypothetical protein